jgi:hypothetical protein
MSVVRRRNEKKMLSEPDVIAREMRMSRRAEARESVRSAAIRLANREQRLQRRRQRIEERLAGQNLG